MGTVVSVCSRRPTQTGPVLQEVQANEKEIQIEDGVIDRSGIERNAFGSEEPSSGDPELWNIDNCEVDILVKYKVGGQMWYVQSRMRENAMKTPRKSIAGFPMNKKALDAKRYYSKDDVEFNIDSTNYGNGAWWKEIESSNPPIPRAQ